VGVEERRGETSRIGGKRPLCYPHQPQAKEEMWRGERAETRRRDGQERESGKGLTSFISSGLLREESATWTERTLVSP
jgi:hypothetical protein